MSKPFWRNLMVTGLWALASSAWAAQVAPPLPAASPQAPSNFVLGAGSSIAIEAADRVLRAREAAKPARTAHPKPAVKRKAAAGARGLALLSSTSAVTCGTSTSLPAEITTLAAALKCDPDLIFEYVYNNIEYEPLFGSNKGPLGALLDQRGSDIDQANLMAALLTAAGFTSGQINFQYGYIRVTGAAATGWLGVQNDGAAINQLLVNGGIPTANLTTGGGGTLTYVDVAHVWLQVTIGGVAYVFDPSFKQHTVKAGIGGLAAAMGYSQSQFLTDAGGTIDPIDNSIANINRGAARSDLTTYANNLVNYIKAHNPAWTVNDVVGGKTIQPVTGSPLRNTSLAYLSPSQPSGFPQNWGATVPNAYRTTVDITLPQTPALSYSCSAPWSGTMSFYEDEAYGHRITTSSVPVGGGNYVVTALIDGVAPSTGVNTSSVQTMYGCINISITHPYAALPSANQSDFMYTLVGVDGLGNPYRYLMDIGIGQVGRGMVAKHRILLAQAQAADPTGNSEAVQGEGLAVIGYTWLAENASAMRLRDNVGATTSQFHHHVGYLAQAAVPAQTSLVGPYINAPLTFLTTQPQTTYSGACISPQVLGAFFGNWGSISAMESAVLQQTQALAPGIEAPSTMRIVDDNVASPFGYKTYYADGTTSGGLSTYFSLIRPVILGNYSANDMSAIDSAISTNGMSTGSPTGQQVLLPEFGQYSYGPGWTGGGQAIVTPSCTLTSLAMTNRITGALNGGSTNVDIAGSVTASNSQTLSRPPSASAPIPAGAVAVPNAPANPLAGNPVDSIGGAYVYSHDDLTTGGGGFPYALTFSRAYSSASNGTDLGLGSGWSHNFSMGLLRTSDPFIGLGDTMPAPTAPTGSSVAGSGESNAISAAQAIAATVVTQDLMANGSAFCTGGASQCAQNMTLGAVGFRWMTDQLTNNAVLVSQPTSSGEYTWLPAYDGASAFAYNPPPGAAGTFTGTVPDSTGLPTVFNFTGKDQSQVAFTPIGSAGNGQIASTITPYGMSVNFTYDATTGALTSIANTLGRHLTLAYTGAHVTSVTDDTGRSISYGYSATSLGANLTTAGDPLGATTRFTYDTTGTYDTAGHLTQVAYPSKGGAFVTNWYDALGRVSQQADALGNQTQFYVAGSRTEIVNALGGRQVSYQTPRGLVTMQAAVMSGTGVVFSDTPQSSSVNVVSNQYDGQDRLVLATAPLGGTTAYAYSADLLQNLMSVTQTPQPGSGLSPLTTTYSYDVFFNKPATVTDPRGLTSTLAYDPATGNLTRTVADYGGSGHLNTLNSFTYNARGQLLTATDPLGTVTALGYDGVGNLTAITSDSGPGPAHLNLTSTATYDALGNVRTATDPKGNTTALAYDAVRRLASVTLPTTGSAAGPVVTAFTYDADGELLQTQQSANGAVLSTASSTYTATGSVATSTDPKGAVTRYAYDALDRVQSVTDPVGTVTTYGYDVLNRAVASSNPAIQPNPLAQQAYTADGLIASQTVARSNTIFNTTTLAYDGLDRLQTVTYPDPGTGATTETYTYDADSNVLTRKTRAGSTIAFSYDTLNRLVTKTPPSSPVVSYSYDLASNLVGVSDTSAAIATPSASASYTVSATYDALNRPTGTTWTGAAAQATPTATSVTFTHGYDADNRRISQAASDNSWLGYPARTPAATSYTANNLDQYTAVGAVTPTYDGNGALTYDGQFTYTYDVERRLKSILNGGAGVAAYDWDAQGRRKQKTVGSAKTVYVTGAANDAVLDYDGTTGAILRWYPPGSVSDGAGSARQTFIPDVQGSVIGVLCSTAGADPCAMGMTLTKIGYGAYGENPALTADGMRYTGQQLDSETAGSTAEPSGLYYLRARQYSPTLGRFLTADPAQSGTNLYAYAGNSPLNGIDPSGLRCVPTLISVGSSDTTMDGGLLQTFPAYDAASSSCPPVPAILPWNTEVVPYGGDGPAQGNGGRGTSPVTTTPPKAQQPTAQPQQSQTPRSPACTDAQAGAAQMAEQFGDLADKLKWMTITTGAITGVAGLGEGPTLGADTPFTVAGGATTSFFGTGATVIGAAAAGFRSYATGSTSPLLREALTDAISLKAGGILEKIPVVGKFSEAITGLAEKGLDVLNEVQAACGVQR